MRKNLLPVGKLILMVFCSALIATAVTAQSFAQTDADQQRHARIVNEISGIKIYFKSRSADVPKDSRTKLMNVADVFRQLPAGSTMEIVSFTDTDENKGKSKSLNQRLSESRSAAVRDELIMLGVDPDVLAVRGFGSEQAIADNSTPLGRAQNRRTEFKITFIAAQKPESKPQMTPPTETAPETTAEPCPYVSVSSSESVTKGEVITFSADISGGDSRVTPIYKWYISAGEILSGQGTSSVSVSTKNLKSGGSVTATLDVGGYDRSCSASNSGTTSIAP